MHQTVQHKVDAVAAALRSLERVIVAFSGGVDSVVLARLAGETLGRDAVLAVTGRSPSLPSAEAATVETLAAECGVPHEFLDTAEFENAQYVANPNNRCYFCKTELYDRLAEVAARRGYAAVLSGANADDLGDYRPGLQAASERRVVSPLADAGLTKADVRVVAADRGLSIADKPASPCLSSRVPYGEAVTPEKLRRIDEAETFLRSLGFAECRVRHHEQLARIELQPADLARLADDDLRARIDGRLRELGFQYVTLDLRGFRSGSLNEVILGTGWQGGTTEA